MRMHRTVPWAVVLAAGIAYPTAVLAGGGVHLPSRGDCVHVARSDGDLEVVFGRFESMRDASTMLSRVLTAGFKGSQLEPDGCGLLKVAVHGIPTLKVGGQVIDEARSVGLKPSLETVSN